MTNLLTKNSLPYVAPAPAVPGSAGVPAHYVYEKVTTCGIYSSNVTYAWVTPTDGSSPQYIPTAVDTTRPAVTTYRCTTSIRKRYIGAVPASPAVPGGSLAQALLATYNLGWNAGARSVTVLTGDGNAQFTLSLVIGGIVAGFNNLDASTMFTEIKHGLYFAGGTVRVIESGVIKASVGSYASGDTFKIVRAAGTVTYYKGASLLYTSLVASTGTVFLDTSLYSAGDALVNPSLTEGGTPLTGGSATLTLPRVSVYGGQGAYKAQAVLKLPHLTLVATGGIAQPGVAYGAAALPALTLGATGLTGERGGATLTLPKLKALGWGGFVGGRGQAALTLPHLKLTADAFEGNHNGTLGSVPAWSTPTMTDQRVVYVALSSTMNAVLVLTADIGRRATMISTATLSALESAVVTRFAAMFSTLGVHPSVTRISSADVTGRDDGFQVWAVDLESNASSMYEHYDFNSFADIDRVSYGAKADGIYKLEGKRDGPEWIRASLDFGRQNFGSNFEKRVPNVYVGVASNGKLLLRASVDGGPSYFYEVRDTETSQQVQRFDLGKGLKGSYFRFELFNAASSDMDLDTIEFTPVVLSRRI